MLDELYVHIYVIANDKPRENGGYTPTLISSP